MAKSSDWLYDLLPLVGFCMICAYYFVHLLLFCLGRLGDSEVEEERTDSSAFGGLQGAETILSLPTMSYSAGGGEADECAVCLGELMEKQMMVVLPECKHRFHDECIGTWLPHNPTCPLCRSQVRPQPAVVIEVR